jgi:hypothetical protein
MQHYYRSKVAAESLDRMVSAALIVALGITDAGEAAALLAGATFIVMTKAGALTGNMYRSNDMKAFTGKRMWGPAWVHFRFDDEKAAKALGTLGDRINGYSGKWNWHFSNMEDWNAITAIDMLNDLNEIVIGKAIIG